MSRRLVDALVVAVMIVALVALAWIAAGLEFVEPADIVP